MATYAAAQMAVDKEAVGLWRVHVRERERDNFIEINRTHDDTCTNTNYNEGLCGLIQGDLR